MVDDFKSMILLETENFITLNKRAGFVSQGGDDLYKNMYTLGREYFSGKNQSYFIVHRLDKIATGTMFIAKNKLFGQILGNIISEKLKIHKYYIAIAYGFPSEFRGVINQPLSFKNKAVLANFTQDNAKESETKFQVLAQMVIDKKSQEIVDINVYDQQYKENHKDKKKGGNMLQGDKQDQLKYKNHKIKYYNKNQYHVFTVMKVKIRDGRKHQIRAHLSLCLKNPILGDNRYGFDYNIQEQLFGVLDLYKKEQEQQKQVQIESSINGAEEIQDQHQNKYFYDKKNLPVFLHCRNTFIQEQNIYQDILQSQNEINKDSEDNFSITCENGEIRGNTNIHREGKGCFEVNFTSQFPLYFEEFYQQMFSKVPNYTLKEFYQFIDDIKFE